MPTPSQRRRLAVGPVNVRRLAQALALGSTLAFALLAFSQVRGSWWMQDADAYWQAGMRLREGAPLYPALASQDASSVYRYAPWFAGIWVPLTYLPQPAVYAAWGAVLGMAAIGSALLSLRAGGVAGWTLGILVLAMLLPAAASGNVQPLVIATLVYGVERRTGPFWIASAASLKAAPVLFVLVYLGRREWRRSAVTLVLTALLLAPFLATDLAHYPLEVGAAAGPLPGWADWAIAGLLGVVALAAARTNYGWLLAATAVVLAIPRWSYYQGTFAVTGLADGVRHGARR
jgi:hypothetical protein